MKDTSLNKWTAVSLVVLIAIIIVIFWFNNETIAISFLSAVFGFLLKALTDTVTMSQRRQWDLDDIARDRTLKYYETKLNEMTLVCGK